MSNFLLFSFFRYFTV